MIVDENEYYRVIVPDYLLSIDSLEGFDSELSGEQSEDQPEDVESIEVSKELRSSNSLV